MAAVASHFHFLTQLLWLAATSTEQPKLGNPHTPRCQYLRKWQIHQFTVSKALELGLVPTFPFLNTMCGIFAIFSSSLSETDLRKELISCSSKLRHRGPDWSGYKVVEADIAKNIKLPHGIAHERLAIMDPESGSQPLVSIS